MASTSTSFAEPHRTPEPTWEIARIFPSQGNWSVDEYLALNGNYLIEFIDGRIEVLPMPKFSHQMIVLFLCNILRAFVMPRNLGKVVMSPFKVHISETEYREPDVAYMSTDHFDRTNEDFWMGADLVMEVVSEDDRRRDLVTKRAVYARAGIPEYWIVDPRDARITVLKLAGDFYEVHGEFQPGQIATSNLLPEFSVDVTAALAAQ
jgi:Uma2 family endonuclease